MTDISRHPVLKEAYDLCQAIEMLGASDVLTAVTIKASALLESIDALAKERDGLKAQLAAGLGAIEKRYYEDLESIDLLKTQNSTLQAEVDRMREGLEKERDALKAQLEAAFKKGWFEGIVTGLRRSSGFMHKDKAELDAAEVWKEWMEGKNHV